MAAHCSVNSIQDAGVDHGNAHASTTSKDAQQCASAMVRKFLRQAMYRAVEEDEAAHSVHIGLLGAIGVVLDVQCITDLIEGLSRYAHSRHFCHRD